MQVKQILTIHVKHLKVKSCILRMSFSMHETAELLDGVSSWEGTCFLCSKCWTWLLIQSRNLPHWHPWGKYNTCKWYSIFTKQAKSSESLALEFGTNKLKEESEIEAYTAKVLVINLLTILNFLVHFHVLHFTLFTPHFFFISTCLNHVLVNFHYHWYIAFT